MSQTNNLYHLIGGDETVRMIVELFYSKVQKHPSLAPLFPDDIEPVIEKQHQFMTQLFGGPALYSEVHGHPMMRARHLSVPIDQARADAWLGCMQESLEEVGLEKDIKTMMMERFTGMAYHFMNR